MTREEAILWLNEEIKTWESECQSKHPIKEALYVAIEALEQEPFMNKPCISSKVCEHDKGIVLGKIRAEIEKQEKWLLQAGYNTYNVDIAFNSIKLALAKSEDKK